MSPSGSAQARVAALAYWSGPIEIAPLKGGITNTNFLVKRGGERFVVRIGDDIPVHGVLRFNELAVSEAAYRAGVSPEVVYHEPGVMILRFVVGRTLTPDDMRAPEMLERLVPLLKRVHMEIPKYLCGPILTFWVFHILRDYAKSLAAARSRHAERLGHFLEIAETLARAVGPIEIVLGHNDLLAANFIDDGERLWLVDWDYAGFNGALFDLANLASNAEFTEGHERRLLESYYGRPSDESLWRRYGAMKCASLLREAMWSMVSEVHSTLDFDYAAYTAENLARFERAYASWNR